MRILGCFAIMLGVLGSSKAQDFEWTHHFPSMGFSTSLEDASIVTREYGVYETGLYYKGRYGFAIKRSHVCYRLSPAILNGWVNDFDPDWQHTYVMRRGVYQYTKMIGLTFSYRLLNADRWTVEPNVGLGLITYPEDNFTSAIVSQKFRFGVGSSAPIRFSTRPSRQFTSSIGLRLEYRIKQLGIFLNTVLINRPEATMVLSQARENNLTAYKTYSLEAPLSLVFEFGLRVRITNAFHWINIK